MKTTLHDRAVHSLSSFRSTALNGNTCRAPCLAISRAAHVRDSCYESVGLGLFRQAVVLDDREDRHDRENFF